MKTILFFLVFAIAGSLKAQTLKDALFGGKLKTDSATVIKKGDSLKLRTDLPQKIKKDSLQKETTLNDSVNTNSRDTITTTPTSLSPVTNPIADNNKNWKQFVDEYTGIIKNEVLPSRKIKRGTYSVLIDYEIELDGKVATLDISCSPESSFLVEQIKKRMMENAPQLNPVLLSNGKPRKAIKKQALTFVKEKE